MLLLLVMNFLLLILNFLLLVLYLFLMLLMLILSDCLLDTDILLRSILKAFVSSKVHSNITISAISTLAHTTHTVPTFLFLT